MPKMFCELSPRQQQVYTQGHAAALAGKSRKDNPFPWTKRNHVTWFNAWLDAQDGIRLPLALTQQHV